MSFQGDVAGIGLGELLQSLSRGGQDGVLRLFGEDLSSVLGVKGGLLFLLPGPEEDDEELRLRCQRAWCEDPQPAYEAKRRADIAHASRLQTLYDLIHSKNVHFRFEPGRVPLPEVGEADLAPEAAVPWAQGISVEYVLLEHARLSDEASDGADRYIPELVPRILDAAAVPPELAAFAEHCTGRCTLRELADRLGWTLLQTSVSVRDGVRRQALRMSEPRELLVAAQHELHLGRIVRGKDRLVAWLHTSEPGPPYVGDAELVLAEWEEGDLKGVLALMEPRTARALLRKLDFADPDRDSSVARWEALRQAHRHDNISAVHLSSFRIHGGGVQEQTALHDLMRLIRGFEEEGKSMRARILLRLATAERPRSEKACLELATQMLEMGMQEEGIGWLLDLSHDLLKRQKSERAMSALREVLREVPGHEEATELYQKAQAQTARRRRRKVHGMIGAAVTVVLGLSAAVHYRAQRTFEGKLARVEEARSDPRQALRQLADLFPESDATAVQELRRELEQEKAELEARLHAEWMAEFEDAQEECETGDPLLGLRATLALPAPPKLDGPNPGFPARSEILNVLANRLEDLTEEVDPPLDATAEELDAEKRLVTLLEQALETSRSEVGSPEVEAFLVRTNEIRDALVQRRQERHEQRVELARHELEEQQDHILTTARLNAKEGRLARALLGYQRLIEMDEEGSLARLFADEVEGLESQLEALERARALSEEGHHAAAIELVRERTERPHLHRLPWRVESQPPGAEVVFADGSTQSTPFTLETTLDSTTELTFRLAGHETREVVVEEPRDLDLHMHRKPDRAWSSGYRVETAPVPIGDDHLIADRAGRLARLTLDGETAWERELETLAGVARTPVFLERRPGFALVVSEDGQAWVVDAATGELEGPWSHSAPPVQGPTSTEHGVSVRFADDRIAVWTRGVEPEVYEAQDTYLEGSTRKAWNSKEDQRPSTVEIVRRSPDSPERLRSRWTEWEVRVRPDEYVVTYEGRHGFTVQRVGTWSFVGWEAPNGTIPDGRLWVSDEAGVRCFRPVAGVYASRADDVDSDG